MIQTVVKRDGRIVGFDKERIASAIRKAMLKTDKGEDDELINQIVDRVEMRCNEQASVDDIQNMVEKELMKSSRKDAAKVYITYRNQRDIARKAKTREVFLEIIEAKNNDITRENANMNADTPAGMMMKFASETTKPFVDDYLLSERSLNAVKNNYLHIHDKDYYPSKSLTCVSARTNITIKLSDGRIEHVKASYLDKYFSEEPTITPQMVSPSKFIWIMGRNGWTKITGISRRILTKDDNFYFLKTHKGCGLEVTGEHLIPVLDYRSGKEVVKKVDDIIVGDKLLKSVAFDTSEIKNDYIDIFQILTECDEISKDEIIVKNIKELREWLRYKYKVQSLSKLLNSSTYRYGTSYIKINDLSMLCEKYDIPFEVLNTLDISCFNSKDFLPIYLPITNELAKIIGYLHTDGSISYNKQTGCYQIAFIGFNKEINENFRTTFSKIFNNHLTKRRINGKEAGYCFSSKLLALMFKKVLGHKNGSSDIAIPDFIMNGDEEIKWSYISAVIDGDGCVGKTLRDGVTISSVCKSFIQEINLLLSSLNVEASISEQESKGTKANFPNGVDSIRNFNAYSLRVLGQENVEKVLNNLNCVKMRRDDRIYAEKPSIAVIYSPSLIKSKLELSTENEVVYDLETVEHWWTANGYIVHNCLQHPLNKILSNGFAAGHGESRPTKRIETASIMGCISMETVQNEMHGGQAIPAFDFYLAPYVRKSYIEEIKSLEKISGKNLEHLYNIDIDDYIIKGLDGLEGDERYIQHAINETVGRVHQSMEAFIHNMNTIHSRGGNQVVFSSINYGTDTSAEGRCVIRELLISTYEGIGNGSTAIFPIQIWKKKRGVSYLPEDRNYDLYKLACKVAARRFFPNFVNLDATFNTHELWREDDPNRYQYEIATMGCVDGSEIITYKTGGEIFVSNFSEFWKKMIEKGGKPQDAKTEGYEFGEFMDLTNVEIKDKNEFVKCYRVIKNPDKGDWYKVTITNGRVLTVTSDHPWSIKDKGVVYTKDLTLGDVVTLVSNDNIKNVAQEQDNKIDIAWLKGFILCDGCYDGQMISTIGMDERDIAEKYSSIFHNHLGSITQIHEQHRGVKGDYLELKNYSENNGVIKQFKKDLLKDFRGLRKKERHIPFWVFRAPKEVRISFLAGMMDADGYINISRKRSKCQIGSTNKSLAIETCILVQTLNMPCKIFENHYSKINADAIRYRVEFDAFEDLVQYMASEKKKIHYTFFDKPIVFEDGKISKIEFIGTRNESSYDVTTESEHFNVSGIRSHNCRTRVFENRFGEKTSIGRGNLSFSTINIVRLAIECMDIQSEEERIKKFFEKLDVMLETTALQLCDRYDYQKTALVKQFPLLMSGLWNGSEKLKPTDTVESVLNQGTLGIGFIGLAECLIALTGKHHGECEKSQELGLKIISHMRDKANEYSEKYQHNFSILATPAEGLSGKFTAKDRKDFGIIKGVTDKIYYTNSNHVPVYYKCSPKHKAEVEGPYHELTRGGHIFYVEIDGDATHNPQAIMDIVDLVDKYNIGYCSVNHNRNRCMDCGYEDAQDNLEVCPKCGSHNIDKLQRITGYLVGTTDRWNKAKLAELHDRVVHK